MMKKKKETERKGENMLFSIIVLQNSDKNRDNVEMSQKIISGLANIDKMFFV